MTLFLWELALTATQTKAEETHFDCNGYKYNEIRLTESCSLFAAQRYSIQNILLCLEREGANIGLTYQPIHLPAHPKILLFYSIKVTSVMKNTIQNIVSKAKSLDKVVFLPKKLC